MAQVQWAMSRGGPHRRELSAENESVVPFWYPAAPPTSFVQLLAYEVFFFPARLRRGRT